MTPEKTLNILNGKDSTNFTVTMKEIVAEALKGSKPKTKLTDGNIRSPDEKIAIIRAAILKAGTPALGGRNSKGLRTKAIVRLFDIATSWEWYITAYSDNADGGPLAYGLVKGFAVESGYIPLSDLAEFPEIVVDLTYKPKTIKACLKQIARSR
jgi:hypothetical protein